MDADEAQVRQHRVATPDAGAPPEASLFELAGDWVVAAGSRARCTARLALAEARLAATSMALMLVLAIVAAGFVLSGWGLLMASLVSGLLAWGVPAWSALAALAALHAVGAWLLLRWIARLSVHLELPATRRQLGAVQAEQPEQAEPSDGRG